MKYTNSTQLTGLLYLVISLPASSCTHYYYAPNSNNIPLLKEQNDGRIQLKYSIGNHYDGAEVQSAYAVGKHAGIQLNFFTAWESKGEYESGNGSYYSIVPVKCKWIYYKS